MPVKASAPGTIMLLGEHAVLHGRRALVAAVDRRITVTAGERTDRVLHIQSALGEYRGELDRLPDAAPFRFVLAAVRARAGRLPCGLDLTIESTFSDQVGLGSSAAVTVAATVALEALAGAPPTPVALHQDCLETILSVQGAGSGSDLAAAIFGGVVEYRLQPRWIRPLPGRPPILLMYCGFKTPTPEVIRIVEAHRAADPARIDQVFDRMDKSTSQAAEAVVRGDWIECGRIFNENHCLMQALGVSNRELDEIQALLASLPGVYGAKISGSGLGDCVLALGSADLRAPPYPVIPASISTQGVSIDQT